jgi:hypothetical protein
MPTLREYQHEMLRRESGLGRIEDISALAAQTLTVNRLRTGTRSSGRFEGVWLVRVNTATSSDRERLTDLAATAFVNTTGVLTHSGLAYVDTTATSEQVMITEHEPALFDEAVQQALQRTRYNDVTILPGRNTDHYYLRDLPWLVSPADIHRVTHRVSRVLSRNRDMGKWNGYSSGALVPDDWTLSGSGATFARDASNVYMAGAYSLAATRSGADALISQTVGLVRSGVTADDLQGETLTAVLIGRAGAGSSLTVEVNDGAATTASSAHSGDDDWEELTAERSISASATTLIVRARLATNETAEAAQLYLVLGSLDDTVRRDLRRADRELLPNFEQQAGQLVMITDETYGVGAVLAIESQRPYTQFTSSRITAGTADGDTSDAPLNLIAIGALAIMFSELLPMDSDADERRAAKYLASWEAARLAHLWQDEKQELGLTLGRPIRSPLNAQVR